MAFDPSQSYGVIADTQPPVWVQNGIMYNSKTYAVVSTPNNFNGTPSISSLPGVIAGSGLYNVTTQNTSHLRAAIARVRAGTGTGKVAFIGDSTTVGDFASSAVNIFTGDKVLAFPNQLAKLLTARGLPAHNDSFFGGQNVNAPSGIFPTDYTAFNPAVVFTGSSWTISGFYSLGANTFQSGTTAERLAFTPTSIFDTIEVYYATNSFGGSILVNVDGGATLSTINTNGATGVAKTTITGVARATHTINLVSSLTGGQFIFPIGVTVRDSTAGNARLELYNMGFSGSFVNWASTPTSSYGASLAAAPYGYFAALPVLAPDVTFINLTINDIANQVSTPSSYGASLGAMVTAALAVGDCVLMVGNPVGAANWSNGVSTAYVSQVYALANANNCPLIDLTQRWTSFSAGSALGFYGDPAGNMAHPSATGHQDIAAVMSSLFQ